MSKINLTSKKCTVELTNKEAIIFTAGKYKEGKMHDSLNKQQHKKAE